MFLLAIVSGDTIQLSNFEEDTKLLEFAEKPFVKLLGITNYACVAMD